METCNIGNPDRITINWPLVDQLMADAGVRNDAELARLSGTPQSTLLRARRGAASPSAIRGLKAAFPDVSFDDLIVMPAEPKADAA